MSVGKAIERTASKVGGALGFNTRASRVAEAKNIRQSSLAKLSSEHQRLKNPGSPTVIDARKTVENLRSAPTRDVKAMANSGKTVAAMQRFGLTEKPMQAVAVNDMSSAARRELSRRRKRNLVAVGAGVSAGIGTYAVARNHAKRDKAARIANEAQ